MIDISPNFGAQNFTVKKEAIKFLQKLGFNKITERSDYEVYETQQERKKRANLYRQNRQKDGKYFVGQHSEIK